MKPWLSLIAISAVFGCCASAGLAGNEWPTESVSSSKSRVKFAAPHFTDEQNSVQHNVDTQSFYTPMPVSEYRHAAQSPYVTEYGGARVTRPVSVQPPVIGPSAAPAHIQEFSTLPSELPAPSFEGGPGNAAPKTLKYKHLRRSAHLAPPRSVAYKASNKSFELHAPLIPVHVIPNSQVAGVPTVTK